MGKLPSAKKITSRLIQLMEDTRKEFSKATKEIVDKSGVIEQDDHYFIKVLVPGFHKEEINIEVDGNVLRVKAKKKEEWKEDGTYSFTDDSMDKSVRIPQNADTDTATAKYDSGILLIRFAKLDKFAKPIIIDDGLK